MQDINFYDHLSKPSRYAIKAKLASVILLAWASFLAMILMFQVIFMGFEQLRCFYFEHKEKTILRELQGHFQASNNAMKIYQLTEALNASSKEMHQRSALLQHFQNYDPLLVQFSPSLYLKALAESTQTQLWLTQVSFLNQGKKIKLEGKTSSTSQLMKFVFALENAADFHHQSFEKTMNADASDPSLQEFTLTSSELKP